MLFRKMIAAGSDTYVEGQRFLNSRQMVHIITNELQLMNNVV
jgi:hypothetical protein